jgi:hypothetical protein
MFGSEFELLKCPNLKFSQSPFACSALLRLIFFEGFTPESQRSPGLRRVKAKLGHFPNLKPCLVLFVTYFLVSRTFCVTYFVWSRTLLTKADAELIFAVHFSAVFLTSSSGTISFAPSAYPGGTS